MKHFAKEVSVLGWKQIGNQFFRKVDAQGKLYLMSVYVDDVVIAGPDVLRELALIRERVKTTEPEGIKKLLGVAYRFRHDNFSWRSCRHARYARVYSGDD